MKSSPTPPTAIVTLVPSMSLYVVESCDRSQQDQDRDRREQPKECSTDPRAAPGIDRELDGVGIQADPLLGVTGGVFNWETNLGARNGCRLGRDHTGRVRAHYPDAQGGRGTRC